MFGKERKWQNLLLYIGLPLALVAVVFFMSTRQAQKKKTDYYQVVGWFQQGEVTEYELDLGNGSLTYKLKGQEKAEKYSVPNVQVFLDDINEGVTAYNKAHPDAPIKYNLLRGSNNSWWATLLPSLVLVLLIGALVLWAVRRMNQTIGSENNRTLSFGKAKTKSLIDDEKRKTTFEDVAGAEEEKEELEEIVEFLKDPKHFNELGARIPKGVLLVGPPGTGKTLLARAVAGEAGVPFLSISGSDFVEMYVGVGASRVRDLFEQAKKSSPAIIFIDEIDAVGRHRGAGMGGGHDEREQTLNQLLVEMDGFGANEGVIIIAATNRPDILDPALLRPGRFDRQVTVGYPDAKGREAILKVHSKGKPLGPDVDLGVIAQSTIGFTGADLENLLNEAALLAARRNLKAITKKEIDEATIKVLVGTEKKSHKMSEKEKKLTAFHEAGHAIATYHLKSQDPVHQISIIPRGMAGGYTMSVPTEERTYRSKLEMLDELVTLLGGRVAESLVLGDISTGASNDIQRATKIARDMITKYGMSDRFGPVSLSAENDEVFIGRDYGHVRDYSEETAGEIDEEISKLVHDAYQRTEKILTDHRDQLDLVAGMLMEKEKLEGFEFNQLMEQGFLEEPKEESRTEPVSEEPVLDGDERAESDSEEGTGALPQPEPETPEKEEPGSPDSEPSEDKEK